MRGRSEAATFARHRAPIASAAGAEAASDEGSATSTSVLSRHRASSRLSTLAHAPTPALIGESARSHSAESAEAEPHSAPGEAVSKLEAKLRAGAVSSSLSEGSAWILPACQDEIRTLCQPSSDWQVEVLRRLTGWSPEETYCGAKRVQEGSLHRGQVDRRS